MKGWRTLAINGGLVVVMALLNWATGINWTDYVPAQWAPIVIAVVNIGLRFATTTSVGAKS